VVNTHSSAELSSRPPGHDHPRSRSPGADLEKLLHLAEWLLEKCERHRTKQTWLFHYGTGLGGAVLTAAGLVWYYLDPDLPLRMALAGGILGSAGAVASVSFAYWLNLRQRKKRDQQALDQVLELLRGFAADLDTREGLSAAERAAFRIRLARLGVNSQAPLRPGPAP
jgi:hypothetical protein